MSRESVRSYILYLYSLLVIVFHNKIVLVILCKALVIWLVIMMRYQIRDKLQHYYYVVSYFVHYTLCLILIDWDLY